MENIVCKQVLNYALYDKQKKHSPRTKHQKTEINELASIIKTSFSYNNNNGISKAKIKRIKDNNIVCKFHDNSNAIASTAAASNKNL